jgi:predicted aminopeptidase
MCVPTLCTYEQQDATATTTSARSNRAARYERAVNAYSTADWFVQHVINVSEALPCGTVAILHRHGVATHTIAARRPCCVTSSL